MKNEDNSDGKSDAWIHFDKLKKITSDKKYQNIL